MDRIEVVDSIELGAVNRSVDVRVLPGGKGFIVARALRMLDVPVTAYGFAGGLVGAFLRSACTSLGILDRHEPVAGESRICSIIVERKTGRSTVLNEPGPKLTHVDGRRALAKIAEDCRSEDIVVLTGSVPPGLSASFYGDAVAAVQQRGALAAVDTSGAQLRRALARAPWLVKTNAAEFTEACLGRAGAAESVLIDAMRRQLDRGSWGVVVTRGADGALAVTRAGRWRVDVPKVKVVNATGSGDVFLAGLLAALLAHEVLPVALARAAAGAVGSATILEPTLPARGEREQLYSRITLTEC